MELKSKSKSKLRRERRKRAKERGLVQEGHYTYATTASADGHSHNDTGSLRSSIPKSDIRTAFHTNLGEAGRAVESIAETLGFRTAKPAQPDKRSKSTIGFDMAKGSGFSIRHIFKGVPDSFERFETQLIKENMESSILVQRVTGLSFIVETVRSLPDGWSIQALKNDWVLLNEFGKTEVNHPKFELFIGKCNERISEWRLFNVR